MVHKAIPQQCCALAALLFAYQHSVVVPLSQYNICTTQPDNNVDVMRKNDLPSRKQSTVLELNIEGN